MDHAQVQSAGLGARVPSSFIARNRNRNAQEGIDTNPQRKLRGSATRPTKR